MNYFDDNYDTIAGTVNWTEKDDYLHCALHIRPKVNESANELRQLITIQTVDGDAVIATKQVDIRKNPKDTNPEILKHSDVFLIKFKLPDGMELDRDPVVLLNKDELTLKDVKAEAEQAEAEIPQSDE